MANKRINDLQARSDFDATCNVAVDDASQTWRATGAQILTFVQAAVSLITGKTEDTAPQSVDMLLTYDDSATALKKVSKANLLKKAVSSKTASFTAGVEDDVLICDATSGAIVATLPAASGVSGKIYTFKKIDSSANAITVTRAGSDTIDGATTYVLSLQYESIDIVCDGTVWHII